MNQLLSARRSVFFSLGITCALVLLTWSGFAQSRLNVSLVGSHEPPQASTGFGDVWGSDNLACLGVWTAYNTFGCGIYSITNPAAPQLLTVYNFGGGVGNRFEQGVIRNRILYLASWGGGNLASGGSGLHILSLTNPVVPVLLSRITASTPGTVVNGFDNVHTLFLERNFLYEAAHNVNVQSVKVFDVSNPAAPVYVRDVVTTNTTKVHQITVRTNQSGRVMLYTSGWGGNDNSAPQSPGQTDIWDVTEIGSQPAQWLGRLHSGYNSHSSWPTPDGNTLIVCRELPGGEVRLYDISNPASLTPETQPLVIITPASMGLEASIPHNPVVVSNYLFLSWYQNGLQIFDISDRTKPVRVGFFDTYPAAITSSFQGNWGVDPSLGFDRVLLSDIQSGLYIVDASAVLTPTNNYPPLIVQQPSSLTATQGGTVVFSPVVTGSLLNFQWRRNGANLAGATTNTLTLSNVQSSDAGSYTFVVSNATAVVTSAVATISIGITPGAQLPFLDEFSSTSSSTNWDLFDGSANAVSDYSANWSFDYSTYFSAFNGATISPAPATADGSTKGLRLSVNNNDVTGITAGVSLYPRNRNFSGAYKLKFDLWINYPGGNGGSGSVGSTEFATFGLNHASQRVNWDSSTANPSDGLWFAVNGEGGDTGNNFDYRAYVGNPVGSPTALSFANSGFGATSAVNRNNTDPYWQSLFPAPLYETPGVPGKRWTQVEVTQDTNRVITWRMNGNLIAQRTNTSAFTNGNVMIGFMDTFNSIASPAADAFVLFDNVRVEIAVTAAPPVIVMQPEPRLVYPEEDAAFSVAATGGRPLTYQWFFNGGAIPGATSNSYTRAAAQAEHVGNYSVSISNQFGVTLSGAALLSLRDSPYLSAVQATPGGRSALISWTTTLPSDSQVQYAVAGFAIPNVAAAAASFSESSHRDPELTTQHVVLLTGLEPGTRYSFQTLSIAKTNTYVSGVYQFITAGSVILDNTEADYVGSWTEGVSSLDKYSTNYRFASTVTGAATATATWRPIIPTSGKYDVFIWYPAGANRAANAPYSIAFEGGITNITINQQDGGGEWRLLAQGIALTRGTNSYVRLNNSAGPSVVLADAVRFDYVESQEFPTNAAAPNWWQQFFFGGPADLSLDTDGDFYTAAQEYAMGTSPTNAQSQLQLAGDVSATNSANVTFWPFLHGRSYSLISRTNLNSLVWQKASTNAPTVTPDGRGTFALATTNDAQSYFRLKIAFSTNAATAGRSSLTGEFPTFTAEAACGPFRVYVK